MSAEVSSAPFVQQPRSRLPAVLAWLIIIGLAGLVVITNARSGESRATQTIVSYERARISGMLVVQMSALRKDAASGSVLVQQRLRTIIDQLEAEAKTIEDRLRVAVIAGESLGADEALAKLQAISSGGVAGENRQDLESLTTIYRQGAASLSAAARETLVRRHGYVGRIALAYGIAPDMEPRKTLQSEALWFTIRLSVVGVAAAFGLILAIGAFILACVWFTRGQIKKTYLPTPGSNTAFLEGFAIYLASFVGLGVLLRFIGMRSLQWNWVALLIVPIVWGWTVWRGTTPEERKWAFGWHRGQGVLREIAAGMGGYLAGLVVVAAGILLTFLLVRITGVQTTSPIMQELGGNPLQLAAVYAMACIFAPLIEETMFRGILFHHLRRRWNWLASTLIVSGIFAMLHPQGWVAIPALSSIAIVLSALREWRGSLIAPMTAHACSNFLVLTLALLFLR